MPNDPRPRDHTDAAKDIEPETSPDNIASQIATFKGEVNAYLRDPNYNHAKSAQVRERPRRRCGGCTAVEARRRRVRLTTREMPSEVLGTLHS